MKAGSRIEIEDRVGVFDSVEMVIGAQQQLPAHAQVDGKSVSVVHLDEQILASTARRDQLAPAYRRDELIRLLTADRSMTMYSRRHDGGANYMFLQIAPNCFYFGKLRHLSGALVVTFDQSVGRRGIGRLKGNPRKMGCGLLGLLLGAALA